MGDIKFMSCIPFKVAFENLQSLDPIKLFLSRNAKHLVKSLFSPDESPVSGWLRMLEI